MCQGQAAAPAAAKEEDTPYVEMPDSMSVSSKASTRNRWDRAIWRCYFWGVFVRIIAIAIAIAIVIVIVIVIPVVVVVFVMGVVVVLVV